MKEEQRIVITLPEILLHVPVEIIRSSKSRGIVLDIVEKDDSEYASKAVPKSLIVKRVGKNNENFLHNLKQSCTFATTYSPRFP